MIILGRNEVMDIISKNKTCYNIVSIVDDIFKDDIMAQFEKYKNNYNSIHYSIFDDIDYFTTKYRPPMKKHILDILAYAKDKNNLMIHCHAGVSRSPAIALLIAYMKTGNIYTAIKVLNFNKHDPNVRIIRLGGEILNNTELLHEVIMAYKQHEKLISKLPSKKYHIRLF